MSLYLRAKTKGGTFFFTVVTYGRRPLFAEPDARHILREIIEHVQTKHPFVIDAWVLLPEHIHCLWTLPEGDADYSMRWRLIKARFSRNAKHLDHGSEPMNDSRQQRRERAIWQRRFWEHQIRDEHDCRAHFDYVHFNPVKHGLVARVRDWPFSTFHRYVNRGVYPLEWAGDMDRAVEGRFGE
jgi:putative transposase